MNKAYCELCGKEMGETNQPVRGLVCDECGDTLGADMRKREEGWFMRNMSTNELEGYAK